MYFENEIGMKMTTSKRVYNTNNIEGLLLDLLWLIVCEKFMIPYLYYCYICCDCCNHAFIRNNKENLYKSVSNIRFHTLVDTV